MLQRDKQKWPVAVMNQSVFIQKYRIVDQYVTQGNETEEKWGKKRERERGKEMGCMCQNVPNTPPGAGKSGGKEGSSLRYKV